MTPNTLNTARRYAKKHTLTTKEMEDIRKEVEGQTNPPTNPPANLNPKPSGEPSLQINPPTAKDNTYLNQGLEPPPREEGIDSIMMDLLITTYEKYRNTAMNKRTRPMKFKLTKKTKKNFKKQQNEPNASKKDQKQGSVLYARPMIIIRTLCTPDAIGKYHGYRWKVKNLLFQSILGGITHRISEFEL